MTGAWERLPLLDRLAGRRRFARYVGSAAPDGIDSVRGGYRGGPLRGYSATHFSFDADLQDLECFSGWEHDADSQAALVASAVAGSDLTVSRIWFKPETPARGGDTWLLVDDHNRRAVLYKASARPIGAD